MRREPSDNNSQTSIESDLRIAVDKEPESAVAHYELGSFLLQEGQPKDAWTTLQKAVQLDPRVSYVIRLGECAETLGDLETAVACYRASVSKASNDSGLWAKYGRLLQMFGEIKDAEDAYNKVLELTPDDHVIRIALGRLLWETDPERAIECLENGLKRESLDLAARIQILSVLLLFKEWGRRTTSGLMPHHAHSLEDMFFHPSNPILAELQTATTTLVDREPDNAWAKMTDAVVTFAAGDALRAQEKFSTVDTQPFSSMAKAIQFSEGFFDTLRSSDDASLTAGLPEVISSKDGEFDNSDILYMSCNDAYFDAYTRPLLRSLSEQGPGTQVHIHLMDSSEQHTAEAVEFCTDLQNVKTALTVERPNFDRNDPDFARCYFHAIRFVRFHHHLKHYGQTLWMMDVDGLFNRSPEHLFSQIGSADIALRVRPGRLEPWNQFNACLIGVQATKPATDYMGAVAAYIAHFFQRNNLPWGLDQLAMYACFIDAERRGSAPALHLLDDKALDYSYLPEGILWCSSGATKATVLARSQDEDPEASPYQKAFMRYQGDDDAP